MSGTSSESWGPASGTVRSTLPCGAWGRCFFVYTFLEQHAYLLPGIWSDPVHDLRVQWKATGTLVGAFNLFVYGSVIYIGERISGDAEYGHSRTAYALFAVGLLNSFTNFAHHSYHLPQRELVKWIAFVVSMMEIIILVRAVSDLWALARTREDGPFCATRGSFAAAKYWSVAIVGSAVFISIPPLTRSSTARMRSLDTPWAPPSGSTP